MDDTRSGDDGGTGDGDRSAPSEWDASAATWDDDPAVRAYARAAFGSLVETLRLRAVRLDDASVCDFGCGTGLLTELLADDVGSIDAIDASAAMLAVLRAKVERNRWSHVRVLNETTGEQDAYDLIVCSSVCAFLDDYPTTLQRLVAMLRPGGVFVQWDWERDDDNPAHGLSRTTIRDSLDASGLGDVAVGTAFAITVDGQVMRPLIGSGTKMSAVG